MRVSAWGGGRAGGRAGGWVRYCAPNCRYKSSSADCPIRLNERGEAQGSTFNHKGEVCLEGKWRNNLAKGAEEELISSRIKSQSPVFAAWIGVTNASAACLPVRSFV